MLSLFLASALLAPASPRPVSATQLSPTDKWVVDFADNRCVASRTFGGADQPLILGLDQSPAADGFLAAFLLLPAGDLAPWHNLNAKVVGTSEPSVPFYVDGTLKDGRTLVRTAFRGSDISALRSDAAVEVTSDTKRLSFTLVGMAALSKVLDQCNDDLLEEWGYGPDFRSRVATMPIINGSIASLFSYDDFPAEATRLKQQGRVEARLTIGAEGKPLDCTVIRSSGSAALDRETCAIPMRRARFQPARGKDGNPLSAPVVFAVSWRHPNGG